MATNLTGSKVKDTFSQLLHVDGGPTASEKTVYGGTGVATALKVGTQSASATTLKATTSLGYGTGAGGSIAQFTSKSTGVTLNKLCGQIVMDDEELGDSTSVTFTLTNSLITAYDVPYVVIASGATAGAYTLCVDSVGVGSCTISLRNVSSGPLSEAITLTFAILKGVVS